jgi:hypothetical protein
MKTYNLQGYGEVKLYSMPFFMKLFAIAFVWNKKIRCSASRPSQRLIRHEMIHVIQQEEVGFLKFLWLYVKLWFKTGLSYYRHPMERDAREWQTEEGFLALRPNENWRRYL